VPHRPASELIRSLRATLLKLEENFASPEDWPMMAELKRIILLRIADLEFVGAVVEKDNAEEPTQPEGVLLPVIEGGPEAA
jgi:hypothetical protein